MTSHPYHLDIARYFVSYSQPNSALHISATALSSRQATFSSFLGSKTRYISGMSNGYPVRGGIRYGFGRLPMAHNVLPRHLDADRALANFNDLLNGDGHWNTTHISVTPSILQGSFSTQETMINPPMAAPLLNDERRRRSSALSPRSTMIPFPNSFPLSASRLPTPPSSSNYANNVPQALPGEGSHAQGFHDHSVSTISSTTRTSTVSTENSTSPHSYSQFEVFALLSEICTEALRRKWHDDIQRERIRSLATRRSHRSSHRRHLHGRFSPYTAGAAPPLHRARSTMRLPGSITTEQEQPLRFMELMQRVATGMWEDAKLGRRQQRQHQQEPNSPIANPMLGVPAPVMPLLSPPPPYTPVTTGEAETAAIESMRRLYSLGNSIMAASAAAELGESFNVDELADIVGVAASFCQNLGYVEGAERCEDVVRRPFGSSGDGGSFW